MTFLVPNLRQFGRNPYQIPWQFHVIYAGLICFPSSKHEMDFGQVRHGMCVAFAKKMMRVPSDLVSFPTKLPSKRHEKILVTFWKGHNFMTDYLIKYLGSVGESVLTFLHFKLWYTICRLKIKISSFGFFLHDKESFWEYAYRIWSRLVICTNCN